MPGEGKRKAKPKSTPESSNKKRKTLPAPNPGALTSGPGKKMCHNTSVGCLLIAVSANEESTVAPDTQGQGPAGTLALAVEGVASSSGSHGEDPPPLAQEPVDETISIGVHDHGIAQNPEAVPYHGMCVALWPPTGWRLKPPLRCGERSHGRNDIGSRRSERSRCSPDSF